MQIGLIGFGAWGRRHAMAIDAAEGLDLVAISASSEGTLRLAKSVYPDVFLTDDYTALLARPDIDMVHIVTPSDLHKEIGIAALRAGKHVLLEKPIATSVADCDALIAAEQDSGKVLSIGHEFRLSTQWGRIQREVKKGAIGAPRFVNINLFRNQYRQGSANWRQDRAKVGSWILEEAVHFFDLALWFLSGAGDPVSVSASGTPKQGADGLFENFSALVHWKDGTYAQITQCLAGFEHHLTIEVTGTEGAIRSDWHGIQDRDENASYSFSMRPKGFDFRRGVRESKRIELNPSGEIFELAEEVRMTASAVQQGRPLVSAQDARKCVALCIAAEESILTNRPVSIEF